ncbi:MAG: serine/threonine-protein kinase [archaeon]|nr:serine/threonine-protein kinase [archaeon]
MEVDPFNGIIRRFKKIEDFPNTPNEVLSLKDIARCLKVYEKSVNEDSFEFIIYYFSLERYKVYSLRACNRWVDAIEKAIQYFSFIEKVLKKYPKSKKYFEEMRKDSIFLDIDTGSFRRFQPEMGLQSLEVKKGSQRSSDDSKSSSSQNEDEKNINPSDEILLKERDRERKESNLSEISNPAANIINVDSFEILDLLGQGSFGKVYKVKLKETGEIYAMKELDKKYLMESQQLKYAITECNVLKTVSHPFILRLHYSFQTQEFLYMILDYCEGGDLGYHLETNAFEEDEAKFYIAELLLAIEYLHKHDIIYRDLKPENIMIDSEGHIKLADFGLAKEKVEDHSLTGSFCGSPAYLAPEMVSKKGVGKPADIYGIGACLYEMICGTPPFYAEKISELYSNITQKNLMFPGYFSEDLKDLLKNLLCRDPKRRLGVTDKKEIMNHKFFKGINWELLAQRKVEPPLDLVKNKLEGKIDEDEEDEKEEIITKKKESLKKLPIINSDPNSPNNINDIEYINGFNYVRPKSPSKTPKGK